MVGQGSGDCQMNVRIVLGVDERVRGLPHAQQQQQRGEPEVDRHAGRDGPPPLEAGHRLARHDDLGVMSGIQRHSVAQKYVDPIVRLASPDGCQATVVSWGT